MYSNEQVATRSARSQGTVIDFRAKIGQKSYGNRDGRVWEKRVVRVKHFVGVKWVVEVKWVIGVKWVVGAKNSEQNPRQNSKRNPEFSKKKFFEKKFSKKKIFF